jgi:hypothetical protein
LPLFPFGSDFTETEQRLIPALQLLRRASSLQLAGLAARGLSAGQPSSEIRDCLARMGLEPRSRPMDYVYGALLHGALDAVALPARSEAR